MSNVPRPHKNSSKCVFVVLCILRQHSARSDCKVSLPGVHLYPHCYSRVPYFADISEGHPQQCQSISASSLTKFLVNLPPAAGSAPAVTATPCSPSWLFKARGSAQVVRGSLQFSSPELTFISAWLKQAAPEFQAIASALFHPLFLWFDWCDEKRILGDWTEWRKKRFLKTHMKVEFSTILGTCMLIIMPCSALFFSLENIKSVKKSKVFLYQSYTGRNR